ncbi:MAG: hypothetical protein DI586_04290 [Micavibrio aeruginosavorus]|uniref:Uncharacterized protein n=1 Tax=Micavibrio aeruginosavorus TaxID=349221 RepID=A0A2W5FJM3_9BACT|nr:MAG: hypothetical protein DI586_04290 [Micavibrio aeruginosavorus]
MRCRIMARILVLERSITPHRKHLTDMERVIRMSSIIQANHLDVRNPTQQSRLLTLLQLAMKRMTGHYE